MPQIYNGRIIHYKNVPRALLWRLLDQSGYLDMTVLVGLMDGFLDETNDPVSFSHVSLTSDRSRGVGL